MASVTGHVPDEYKDYVEQELVENGPFDSVSQAVKYSLRYTAEHKFGDALGN